MAIGGHFDIVDVARMRDRPATECPDCLHNSVETLTVAIIGSAGVRRVGLIFFCVRCRVATGREVGYNQQGAG